MVGPLRLREDEIEIADLPQALLERLKVKTTTASPVSDVERPTRSDGIAMQLQTVLGSSPIQFGEWAMFMATRVRGVLRPELQMSTAENNQSVEQQNVFDENLRLLHWPMMVLGGYFFMIAGLWACFPAIRSEMLDLFTFSLSTCIFLLGCALRAKLSNPWATRIAWLFLVVLIVPQLVLLVIFGFPKMWPPQ